jgi:FkbM family methyltransferase
MHPNIEKITYVVDHVESWYKIKDDQAFIDILFGWKEKGKNAYIKYLNKRGVVVQAGGYCGIFPLLFADIFDVVYTFEPDPLNFYCLALNCQNSANIVKMQCALGEKSDFISTIVRHSGNRGMNIIEKNNNSHIPLITIDSLNLKDCDLIQLDTEGCELSILLGAEKTIAKFRPVISVEDSNPDIANFLKKFSYSLRETVYRDSIYAI